jgi:hypothetical protein
MMSYCGARKQEEIKRRTRITRKAKKRHVDVILLRLHIRLSMFAVCMTSLYFT